MLNRVQPFTIVSAVVAALVFSFSCNGASNIRNSDNPQISIEKDSSMTPDTSTKTGKYFPFQIEDIESEHYIKANIEGEELYPLYVDFFEVRGYTGNGYTWEGIATQILQQIDPSLLSHIEFDPEAGGFYAIADNKETQIKFVELLSPIFADMKKLDEWLKKVDRAKVDD